MTDKNEAWGNKMGEFMMGRRTFMASAGAALTAVLLAGCTGGKTSDAAGSSKAGSASAKKTAGKVSFTDDLGNKVEVKNPKKVVACMGSLAAIWQLAGGKLAAVTDDAYADYGISKDVPSVGSFTGVDLERLQATEPDFVIMTGAATGKPGSADQTSLRDALVAAKIPVAYFTVTTFEDYLRMLKTCCRITGRSELYDKNGAAVSKRVDKIKKQAIKRGTAPRVLALITYSQGMRVQGSQTMVGAMLKDLGAKNVADENPSLLKDMSVESAVQMDPDAVFVVPMGTDEEAAKRAYESLVAQNPAWNELSAVKNNRVFQLDHTLFLYKPNQHWDKAYRELAEDLAK